MRPCLSLRASTLSPRTIQTRCLKDIHAFRFGTEFALVLNSASPRDCLVVYTTSLAKHPHRNTDRFDPFYHRHHGRANVDALAGKGQLYLQPYC